jgi:hypothetical protein
MVFQPTGSNGNYSIRHVFTLVNTHWHNLGAACYHNGGAQLNFNSNGKPYCAGDYLKTMSMVGENGNYAFASPSIYSKMANST